MVIPRAHRFVIEFDSAFPQGLVLIGDVAPDNEYLPVSSTTEVLPGMRPIELEGADG